MGRRARQRHRASQPTDGKPAAAAPTQARAPAGGRASDALRGARETMDARRPSVAGVGFQRRPDPVRPRAPWHPLPVTEIVLAAGVVGVVIGMARGPDRGRVPLLVGLGLCGLSVVELTVREHLSGYRSHALLIAFIPIVAAETLVALITGDRMAARIALVPEVVLFVVLFRFLRRRFHVARARRLAALGG
jgi:hypothetical protein